MITTYNNCIYQKVEQERSTNTRIPQPAVGMVQKTLAVDALRFFLPGFLETA
ncbi:hypothetical protein [Photorhabdus tasmaniensis]|uniref:hypothetical protein n=1 Tax=Photorhabdus tasmaniensis TaxID=1004159 RepID=UPI0014092365|nr:hypothetical protein [Photorhabdus tasmaniensis]